MQNCFKQFQKLLERDPIKMINSRFNDIVNNFSFLNVSSINNNFDQINQIKNKLELIIIDGCQISNTQYIIIVFDDCIFTISANEFNKISTFFELNKDSDIFILDQKTWDIFFRSIKDINFKNISKNDYQFSKEIDDFLSDFFITKKFKLLFWEIVEKGISGYLIKKGYINSKNDRIRNYEDYFNKKIDEIRVEDEEIIQLEYIDIGLSSVKTIYHIEEQKIFALKIFSNENKRLFEREHQNYLKVHHPFLLKYYGYRSDECTNDLIIEYIEGFTLLQIQDLNLDENDKMKIILEIMIAIEYLHGNNLIYRDLKPNNIILDHNKTVVLIDYDRMIDDIEQNKGQNSTHDFNSIFMAPEILENKEFSLSADIYSLGIVIYYILFEKNPKNKTEMQFNDFPIRYKKLQEMCNKCVKLNPKERPNISILINEFYLNFISSIHNEMLEDNTIRTLTINYSDDFFKYRFLISECSNPYCLYKLGSMYHIGKFVVKDMKKAIHYYTLAADKNLVEAQLQIGDIYYHGIYVAKDINKAVFYFTKAADQNDIQAQIFLGIIYLSEFNDIRKSIYYLTLAADQNDPLAQFNLGEIYIYSLYSYFDINKAIHYLTLSADQNYTNAQFLLSKIYLSGELTKVDTNKGIFYLTQAANQNDYLSQILLSSIYMNGNIIPKDVKKGIHYMEMAANQGFIIGQLYLSIFYNKGELVDRDINKSIHYLSMAADQGNCDAQRDLGLKYYENVDIPRDMNKCIKYFTLAADSGDLKSQLILGLIYRDGLYIQPNIDKFIKYFTLAAEQNNSDAQYELGVFYIRNRIVSGNMNKAIHYLQAAADQNNHDAQLILGYLHYEGIYVELNIKKAIKYYESAANQGNALAFMFLGQLYLENKRVPVDIDKAIHYYSIAANYNILDAQFNLGIIYYSGKYIKRDINKAILYLSLAANQGNSISQFFLGIIYYEGRYISPNINKAIHYLTMAAEKDHIEAQYVLGTIYANGIFAMPNMNKAIYYLTKSANKNFIYAQCDLGKVYLIINDIDKAVYYLTLSADNGAEDSQLNLGLIYSKRQYNLFNIDKAIHYLTLAAKQNNSDAQVLLGEIYLKGTYTVVDKSKSHHYFKLAAKQNNSYGQMYLSYFQTDKNEKLKYLYQAAENSNPNALFILGEYYYYGENVSVDINKAINYLTRAAELNNSKAQNFLGSLYYNGTHVKPDIEKALRYFRLASSSESYALYNLGIYYYEGKYIDRNMNEALFYLNRAFEMKNCDAALLLGIIYHKGEFVNCDTTKAIKYYKEISSFKNEIAKNNLGVIYRSQGKKEIAEMYFKEAIEEKDYTVAMFNMANLYFDEDEVEKSIDMLIKSANKGFGQSALFLYNIFDKLYGPLNFEVIKSEIQVYTNDWQALSLLLNEWNNLSKFDKTFKTDSFELYRNIILIGLDNDKYDIINQLCQDSNEIKLNQQSINTNMNIDKDFYDGFGQDLL